MVVVVVVVGEVQPAVASTCDGPILYEFQWGSTNFNKFLHQEFFEKGPKRVSMSFDEFRCGFATCSSYSRHCHKCPMSRAFGWHLWCANQARAAKHLDVLAPLTKPGSETKCKRVGGITWHLQEGTALRSLHPKAKPTSVASLPEHVWSVRREGRGRSPDLRGATS